MLELRNVTRTYSSDKGPVHALDDVSLMVAPGQFVAVRGPSGCGKTTLLLTAGTLLGPSRGSVHLEGKDVYRMSPEQRARFRAAQVGFVFQQFHLIPYLSVRDNVRAAALAIGSTDAAQRADALIERFGMADRATHRPSELSTGERQRTALARALLNQPKLLLADEPTGNLDGDNARIVLDHLVEFAEGGGAVLLVTHDAQAAARASETIELDHGRLTKAADVDAQGE